MEINQVNWKEIEEEATRYLSQYLQINTTNPPGDEIRGARFLKEVLDKEGIDNKIIESAPGRANLLAHFPGKGNGKPLLLLNHIDVVPVEEDKWSYSPFSGKVIGGEIWGRGALDCKSLGIIQTMVLILLKRMKGSLNRGVIMAATADEEKGGEWGVGWLCHNYPEFTRVEAVINEGGGVGIPRFGKNYYLCQVGEKGACWFRIVFPGTPGHGSLPREDNCLFSLGQFLASLQNYQSRIHLTKIIEQLAELFSEDKEIGPLLKEFLLDPNQGEDVFKSISDGGIRQLLLALTQNTFVPTVVKGGEKVNVIPSECFCEIDCRILPGETITGVKKEISKILGNINQYTLVELQTSIASESDFSHPLFSIFGEILRRYDPQAVLVPYFSSGATDSRYFRKKNIPAFGFAPLLIEGELKNHQDMIHGHNERISQKNLVFGIKVLYEVVKRFCG